VGKVYIRRYTQGGIYQGGVPPYMPPSCTMVGIPLLLYHTLYYPGYTYHTPHHAAVLTVYADAGRRCSGLKTGITPGWERKEALRTRRV